MTEVEIKDLDQKFSDMDARLDDVPSIIAKALEPDEIKTKEEVEEETAELEASGIKGMFGQIGQVQVMGVPIGKAAVGGFAAVFVSELVDGIMGTSTVTTQGLVKLVLAGAVQFTKKWFGAPVVDTATLLLAYDGIRQLLPIDEWAGRAAGALSGAFPTGGLARGAGMTRNIRQIAPSPAGDGKRDYYSVAFGR